MKVGAQVTLTGELLSIVRRFAEIGFRDVESRRVHLQFVMKRPLAKRGSASSSIFDWLGFSGDDSDKPVRLLDLLRIQRSDTDRLVYPS
jgi:hypothetical protein